MENAGHVASNSPDESVCECASSGKMHRFSGSFSSGIGSSASQVMLLIRDRASHMTGVSGLNNVDKDKTMMLKTYSDPLPIYPHLHELSSDTCRSGCLCVASSFCEENDARYTISLYKDTIHKDAIEFGDPLASFRAPTQQI